MLVFAGLLLIGGRVRFSAVFVPKQCVRRGQLPEAFLNVVVHPVVATLGERLVRDVPLNFDEVLAHELHLFHIGLLLFFRPQFLGFVCLAIPLIGVLLPPDSLSFASAGEFVVIRVALTARRLHRVGVLVKTLIWLPLLTCLSLVRLCSVSLELTLSALPSLIHFQTALCRPRHRLRCRLALANSLALLICLVCFVGARRRSLLQDDTGRRFRRWRRDALTLASLL